MALKRIEIESLVDNHKLNNWINAANQELKIPLKNMKEIAFYKLQSDDLNQDILKEVFCDEIIQKFHEQDNIDDTAKYIAEISFKPGVTDNAAYSAKDALKITGIDAKISTGHLYYMYGDLNKDEAKLIASDLIANDLIQSIDIFDSLEFNNLKRFENVKLPEVKLSNDIAVETIDLDISDNDLDKLSKDNCLALTLEEMQYIRDYYKNDIDIDQRKALNLPINNPTDVELEVIAQTWSEHCKHKIFNANIDYSEENLNDKYHKLGNLNIQSLYKSYVKKATKDIEESRKLDWLISVFSDNAGIVRFDENIDLCIKAETHNSPSALDPYGGALTGILGVNRDILGCGMAARPIANTDVFCFADPKMPKEGEAEFMPASLKSPKRIFEGVHKGVEDGGNKSGIPTVNGAIFFDQDYAGKPLVFVGTVGAMPQQLNDGTSSAEKRMNIGDRAVVIGGAVGADGVHGATFSSIELDETAPATAVQIGDPLTQRRVTDFLMKAQELGLYSAITDNGAGGLSSSIGEMATMTNGVEIDLKLCPVKYEGLTPFEIMISESQERMSLSVPPANIAEFLELAEKYKINATDIGEFNDSGDLKVFYGDELVCLLDLEFLHESLPEMNLKATWNGSRIRKTWSKNTKLMDARGELDNNVSNILLNLLQTPNIASKEKWVRQYDHEVQAATAVKPFVGKNGKGPGNSGVIWLKPHGGNPDNAIAIGCGMAPRISLYDGYQMALFAVDEALRNVVVSGGDIDNCCLLDNFCWPDPVQTARNPDGDYKLGQLVRSCAGLYDICTEYGTPLVSGKDSMKNDYRGKNHNGEELLISVLPTLLVTAMAKAKIKHVVTSDFKNEGDLIYVIGKQSSGLQGSELAEIYNIDDAKLPDIDIKANKALYRNYYQACQKDLIKSGHDISDGGLLVAISESMIGGELGADLVINRLDPDYLFNEAPGRFMVSIAPENKQEFENIFNNFEHIGAVSVTQKLTFANQEISLADIMEKWGAL